LVGASTARSNFFNSTNSARFQIEGNGSNDNYALAVVSNFAGGTNGAQVILGKSGSADVGGTTIVSNGNTIGRVSYQGSDGTQFVPAADIRCDVDGTPGADNMPGKIVFATNGGSDGPTNRVEIGSDGALKLLSGCPGIDFSAKNTAGSGTDTMTSETLDGYEEGTFLPNAFGSTTIGNTVYGLQFGAYVKIGRICHIQIRMSVATMTGTGSLLIGGLPFLTMNDSERGYASISVPYIHNLQAPAATDTYIGAYTQQNSTHMVMGALAPGQQFDEVDVHNGFTLLMGGTYITNA